MSIETILNNKLPKDLTNEILEYLPDKTKFNDCLEAFDINIPEITYEIPLLRSDFTIDSTERLIPLIKWRRYMETMLKYDIIDQIIEEANDKINNVIVSINDTEMELDKHRIYPPNY